MHGLVNVDVCVCCVARASYEFRMWSAKALVKQSPIFWRRNSCGLVQCKNAPKMAEFGAASTGWKQEVQCPAELDVRWRSSYLVEALIAPTTTRQHGMDISAERWTLLTFQSSYTLVRPCPDRSRGGLVSINQLDRPKFYSVLPKW